MEKIGLIVKCAMCKHMHPNTTLVIFNAVFFFNNYYSFIFSFSIDA